MSARLMKLLSLAVTLVILSRAAFAGPAGDRPRQELAAGAGKDLTLRLCGECHPISTVIRMNGSAKEWRAIVSRMVDSGAGGSDEELAAVVNYLGAHYGKKVRINEAPAAEIAEALDITAADARAIVSFRTAKGKFATWQDVANTPGVNARKIETQKKNIVF
jgi:competence ComEA-like helix-hairpin-helix protein